MKTVNFGGVLAGAAIFSYIGSRLWVAADPCKIGVTGFDFLAIHHFWEMKEMTKTVRYDFGKALGKGFVLPVGSITVSKTGVSIHPIAWAEISKFPPAQREEAHQFLDVLQQTVKETLEIGKSFDEFTTLLMTRLPGWSGREEEKTDFDPLPTQQ